MAISATDISLVLSGGSSNNDPDLALGGNPSATRITSGQINNLFGDITPEQSEEGREDYRCVYFFNDGADPVYSLELWVISQVADGSSVELGTLNLDEIQRITISGGTVTGGSFTISYGGDTYVSNFNSDLGTWATSLQAGLRGLEDGDGLKLLEDITITAQNTGSTIIMDITFPDLNGKRNHDLLVIDANNLSPSVDISVTTVQHGSPINTIAPEIDVATTTPSGVEFFLPTQQSPITIPYLASGEGFPLWVRRTTPVGATAVADDGFRMRFRAKSLKPL